MTLMRKCEGCNQPIQQQQFIQLTMRILRSDEGESQDALEEVYGDYCDGCITVGVAVENLANSLTSYVRHHQRLLKKKKKE